VVGTGIDRATRPALVSLPVVVTLVVEAAVMVGVEVVAGGLVVTWLGMEATGVGSAVVVTLAAMEVGEGEITTEGSATGVIVVVGVVGLV
jgi:hypothetical protein